MHFWLVNDLKTKRIRGGRKSRFFTVFTCVLESMGIVSLPTWIFFDARVALVPS